MPDIQAAHIFLPLIRHNGRAMIERQRHIDLPCEIKKMVRQRHPLIIHDHGISRYPAQCTSLIGALRHVPGLDQQGCMGWRGVIRRRPAVGVARRHSGKNPYSTGNLILRHYSGATLMGDRRKRLGLLACLMSMPIQGCMSSSITSPSAFSSPAGSFQ